MLLRRVFFGIFAWWTVLSAQTTPGPDIPEDKPVAFPPSSPGLAVLDTANEGLNNLPRPSYTVK